MSECGRCLQIIKGESHFIKGCDIHVCSDCVHEAYIRCKCCGEYFADEDIVYPEIMDAMCICCTSEHYLICPNCLEYTRKDEAVEFHGHMMCSKCQDAYFSLCDCCYEVFEITGLMDAIDEDGASVKVCPKCSQKKFRRCFECGSLDANYYIFEGKTYCKDCCDKCWNCGKMVPRKEVEYISTGSDCYDVCPDCFKTFDRCAFCGYDHPRKELHKIYNESYCEECLPEYIAQLEEEERNLVMQQLDATLVGVISGLAIFKSLDQ